MNADSLFVKKASLKKGVLKLDPKITHLQIIQTNIARMNQCSFQMKGWMVTIVSAMLALFAASKNGQPEGNSIYLFSAIVPTAIFWFLDSYYLQQERKFRGIYNNVAGLSKDDDKFEVQMFEMPLNKYQGGKYSFCNVLFSKTEVLLYLPVIFGLLIAGNIF